MKASKIISSIAIAALMAILLVFSASAEETVNLHYFANEDNAATVIYTQQGIDKSTYLFLPSSADLTALSLRADEKFTSITISADNSVTVANGEKVNITALFNDTSDLNGEYKVTVTAVTENGEAIIQTVTIMKSENLRTLFFTSEDPVEKGRKWVDTSKDNKTKGAMVYLNADGTVANEDAVTEIKGRGNSTFTDFTKKPYQIKLKNKFNMTGDEDNAQKKWVLLANAGDVTLIHNQLVVALAKGLGLPYTIDCESIDLYYDGEYRGTYMLTDKAEVGDTGIQIDDLDGMIEELNEGTDAYENPVVVHKTFADGAKTDAKADSKGSLKYVEGIITPELAEGTTHHAYLLELDFIYRYPNEQSGFVTNRGQAVVTKNPEYLTKETGLFISNFYQEFEDAVFSPDGYNTETGKYYYDYCDLDSLVQIYLINEYTKNYDSYRSSTYFYMPADENIMYAGPIWDYDLCFTTGYDYNSQIAGNPENFWAATKYLASTLITIESFRDAVKAYLNSEDGEFYLEAAKMLGEDGNIAKFSQNVYASQRMNYKLWTMTDKTAAYRCGDAETYDNAVDFLLDFATKRLEWLSETTSKWDGDNYNAPMDPTKWDAHRRYHELVLANTKAPTCTEEGYSGDKVCGNCGKVFEKGKAIAKISHTYSAATCTTPGKCTACGAENEDKALAEHTYAAATCTTPKMCKVCGAESEDKTLAEHTYAAATCTTPKMCKVCGAESEDKTLAEHTYAAATCTTPKMCKVCGAESEDKTLAAHNWLAATCKKPATCSACGLTKGTVISHDYKLDIVTEDTITYRCSLCNGTISISRPKPVFQTGDINKDGRITAADARLALRFAASVEAPSTEQAALADFNKDGKVTSADARLILRKAAYIDN